jgi:hypothetical protein
MLNGVVLWTIFLVLGVLIWLASVGVWSHPVYRLVLMRAFLLWCAELVRTRKVR